MRPPETYKEKIDVSSEGTSRYYNFPTKAFARLLETSKFSLYFSGSCIPINPKCSCGAGCDVTLF